jgi:hypothetical protein
MVEPRAFRLEAAFKTDLRRKTALIADIPQLLIHCYLCKHLYQEKYHLEAIWWGKEMLQKYFR